MAKVNSGVVYVALNFNGTNNVFDTLGELKAFLVTAASQHVQAVYKSQELKFERIEDVKISSGAT